MYNVGFQINYNLDTTTKDMVRLSQYAVYGTIVGT